MKRLNSLFGILSLLLWGISAAAHPPVRYDLTRIDSNPPGPQTLFVTDMNDKGLVVGGSDASDADNRHAFRWRGGAYQDLHALIDAVGSSSEASGTNNRGEVIGHYVDTQGIFRNFLLRRGRFIPVETFPGSGNSSAEDINNRRQIAGLTFDFGLGQAYIWDRGEVTVLPPLAGGGSVFTVGQINDRGVVVGTSNAASFRLRAVIWQDGEVIDLGVVPGFFDSRGRAINNRGQVVGTVEGPGARAFLWEDDVMTLLPLLSGGTFNAALSINNAGDIVGQTSSSTVSFATLWEDSTPVDLNTRIRRNQPLRRFVTLEIALLINDRGQIVATGRDSRDPDRTATYLLTPRY
jgi:probable HAF family extracellular repeat protein